MQVNQDHLDAEVVAGWLDGSLDRAARAEAEAHAADCDRCQAVLAAMVRIEPEPARRKAWFTTPVRWALPFATAAAAFTLWVAVNPDPGVSDAPQVTPATTVSPGSPDQAEADRALDSAAPAQPAPAVPPGALPDQQAANTQAAPRAARTRGSQMRKEAASATVPPPAVAETVSSDQVARDRAMRQSELPKAAAVPAPPSGPPAPPPSQARAQTQVVSAPSPPLETTVTSAEKRLQRLGGMALGVREFASPDLAARWRLSANGTIHRSTDEGKTWVLQPSGVTTELLSGFAPTANICWIVGRSGVVLLTIDGATWRRVAFPELVDLRSVTATDARTASVTTADGRVFRTADGGITWH
jgi:hypothetical protein